MASGGMDAPEYSCRSSETAFKLSLFRYVALSFSVSQVKNRLIEVEIGTQLTQPQLSS